MPILSLGENWHEMSNSIFWEKSEKYYQFVLS